MSTDLGKHLPIRFDINPGRDLKNPLYISFIHVDGTGMKVEAFGECISYGSDEV